MSVNFIRSGQKVYVEKSPPGVRAEKLSAAIYSLEASREEGLFLLEIADRYILPKKTYGNQDEAAKRVAFTHLTKTGNTGVLLTGVKGTGKSLFVKVISNVMIDSGLPVIQINKAYAGQDIFNFIENVGEVVIVFDEFGKNYAMYGNSDTPTQVSLLSLLDGLTNSKRLHLFTENNISNISEYLLNRPGRVHYHFKYNRLSVEVVEELCKDNGLPEEVIAEMKDLSSRLTVLSFDVVKCLIDEWKLYGGKLQDHVGILNITVRDDRFKDQPELVSIVTKDGIVVPVDGYSVEVIDLYLYIHNKAETRKPFSAIRDLSDDSNSEVDVQNIFSDERHGVLTDSFFKVIGDNHHYLTKTGTEYVVKITKIPTK